MDTSTVFVDVIVPLAVPNSFTYRVPRDLETVIQVGRRVIVQVGKNKLYAGLIRKVHHEAPQAYEAKYIETVLDEAPIATELQLRFWEWMAGYYMCHLGEVMIAALPSGLKLSSESKLVLVPDVDDRYMHLTDREIILLDSIKVQHTLSIEQASEVLGIKSVYPIIKGLIEKGLIQVEEEIRDKYKPKLEAYVCLADAYRPESKLHQLFTALEKKAYKQLEVLMHYLSIEKQQTTDTNKWIKKTTVLKNENISGTALNALIKKGVFLEQEVEASRLGLYDDGGKDNTLAPFQEVALASVKKSMEEKDVTLLHGITSSGKTQVYIELINETIAQGKQVLFLVPEIALTTQLISRLRKYFGNQIGVYHSRFNEQERIEVWSRTLANQQAEQLSPFSIVVGARSAIFLPFTKLGLVIVDEEHDQSFKQHDPAPRYNGRDSAIMLAHLHQAKVVLGTATPTIETYYNAQEGKYGLVKMNQRFGHITPPEIKLADVKEAQKTKTMKSHFTPLLMDEMANALKRKEQIILFQNRRGYAPILECETCAWTPPCPNCDVSLTMHKTNNLLRCHYCGHSKPTPTVCGSCGDTRLTFKGFGTEKIEEELAIYFPEARISRMDLDTTRSKYAYQNLISEFESRQVDILVGTQMITKGLDFDHVSLVGILNADTMLNFPDFRAFERSYQLMSQVAGRAGRKNKQGLVIIQTHNTEHPIIKHVQNADYENLYLEEINERRNYQYPPFFKLIEITVVHRDPDVVNHVSAELALQLKQVFGNRILGPEFPLVARVRNLYHKNILIKLEKELSIQKAKMHLQERLQTVKLQPLSKGVRFILNIDPQ